MKTILRPDATPLISIRIAFHTGSVEDPPGKAGCAVLMAAMLAQGGSRLRTYPELLDALFPIAASVRAAVDKELITFSGETHADNLDAYYGVLREVLLEPGWRDEDFERNREDLINAISSGLRSSNDEELAKEALYSEIYRDHPYGFYNGGSVTSLQSLTIDDLKEFYREQLTRDRMVIAIGGGAPDGFAATVEQDFGALPESRTRRVAVLAPAPLAESRALLIEKETRSVAISLGYPIEVYRGHPDFLALRVAESYLGQHRMGGRLFDQIRERRGLNYGDYAYLEYFPYGMYLLQPLPNHPRREQIFQIWIRPVEFEAAHFAMRLALYELNRVIEEGIPKRDYERAILFLSKYVHLLTKSKSYELGYAIDSDWYGIPAYGEYVRDGLKAMTRERVHDAVRRHLRTSRFQLVTVGPRAAELKEQLVNGVVPAMVYGTPKPPEILREDEVVSRYAAHFTDDTVTVRPVDCVFA